AHDASSDCNCLWYFGKRPSRLDAHVHVYAARTAGLRPSAKPQFIEQSLNFERNPADIIPAHTRNRIEINPQLVGMLQITRAHRMRVQLDAPQIDNPCEPCRVID